MGAEGRAVRRRRHRQPIHRREDDGNDRRPAGGERGRDGRALLREHVRVERGVIVPVVVACLDAYVGREVRGSGRRVHVAVRAAVRGHRHSVGARRGARVGMRLTCVRLLQVRPAVKDGGGRAREAREQRPTREQQA